MHYTVVHCRAEQNRTVMMHRQREKCARERERESSSLSSCTALKAYVHCLYEACDTRKIVLFYAIFRRCFSCIPVADSLLLCHSLLRFFPPPLSLFLSLSPLTPSSASVAAYPACLIVGICSFCPHSIKKTHSEM